MTNVEKEMLYNRWIACDPDTRIRLACEFLQILRTGEEQISWLLFLENHMEEE